MAADPLGGDIGLPVLQGQDEVPGLDEMAEGGHGEPAFDPVGEAGEDAAGRGEEQGQAVGESDRDAAPGGHEMEDGGIERAGRRDDLDRVEWPAPGQDAPDGLPAFVGLPDGPEELDRSVTGGRRGAGRIEKPGQALRIRGRGGGAGAGPVCGPSGRAEVTAGPFEPERRVARHRDQAVAGRGPEKSVLDLCQGQVLRAEEPAPVPARGRHPPPVQRLAGRSIKPRGIERPEGLQGPLVTGEETDDVPALRSEAEPAGLEGRAVQAGKAEGPDGPEDGPGQPGPRLEAREVFEVPALFEVPEEGVGEDHKPRLGDLPAAELKEILSRRFLGQGGQGDEAQVHPCAGLARQGLADLAPDDEGRDDEDLFVERVVAAETGEETDHGVGRGPVPALVPGDCFPAGPRLTGSVRRAWGRPVRAHFPPGMT